MDQYDKGLAEFKKLLEGTSVEELEMFCVDENQAQSILVSQFIQDIDMRLVSKEFQKITSMHCKFIELGFNREWVTEYSIANDQAYDVYSCESMAA